MQTLKHPYIDIGTIYALPMTNVSKHILFRICNLSSVKIYNKYLETSFCMRTPPNFNLKSNKFGYGKYGKEAANICDVFSD